MTSTPVGRLPAQGQNFIYPTLVFEVACTKSFSEVHDKALLYLQHTPGNWCFFIKLWLLRHDYSFAMLGALFQRGTPPIAISCGTAAIESNAARSIDVRLGPNGVSGVGYGNPLAPVVHSIFHSMYIINSLAAALWHGSPGGTPLDTSRGLTWTSMSSNWRHFKL